MSETTPLQRYLEYVEYESERLRASGTRPPPGRHPVVTISRQAGSGSHVVGEELVRRLQARERPGSPPWTVFDRNLVDRVLEEHNLPARLADFMPEDRVSTIVDAIEEHLGLHPPAWSLVRKTADTILRLAELGNVVLIGRAANIITRELRNAFHVRLVGSVERRVAHIQDYLHLGHHAAARYVRQKDAERIRYVKEYYDEDIDDPLLYHLVINTDRVPYAEAARLIAEALVDYASPPTEVADARSRLPSGS